MGAAGGLREKPAVAIVGVGLIGGSLALAWKAAGEVREVVGVVRRAETIDEALSVGAIDRGTLSLAEGVAGADLVVVATPVRSIAPLVREMAPHLKPGAVVTDVGSTKSELCRAIWGEMGEKVCFVGGHPMAGSERDGVRAADPYLFQNAPYVVVPPPWGAEEAVRLVEEMARKAGARPMRMEAEEHDAIVAAVSHLPHVVAASLVLAAAEQEAKHPLLFQLAAGGFRDTTRVASGPEEVWREICLSNAGPILEAIESFERALARFKAALRSRDGEALTHALAEARRVRRGVPAKAKGIVGDVYDAVVHVVDRPGAIHEVTGIIGRRGINIIDIEILRVREGEGGTLRLGFERLSDLDEAVRLLREAGYQVRPR